MILPVVIFFCIALLNLFSYIGQGLFVVQYNQVELDKRLEQDMDSIRCVRALEKIILQAGSGFLQDSLSGQDYILDPLPNQQACKVALFDHTKDQLSEIYIFHSYLVEKSENIRSYYILVFLDSIDSSTGELSIKKILIKNSLPIF